MSSLLVNEFCGIRYFIKPMCILSDTFGTPLNALEPFAALMNSYYFLPFTAVTYLILISDSPKLDDSSTFVIFRTGRTAWIVGQLLFLVASSLTFILFLLFSSMITVASRSYLINAWSLVSKQINREENIQLKSEYPFAAIEPSVLNQSRPYALILHSIILILLFTLCVGIIMMLFALIRKKIFGIFANLSFIAAGLVLSLLDSKAKWLFPISNAVFGWHYDGTFDKTVMPIAYSYLYYIVLTAVLSAVLIIVGKRCSVHIVGSAE